MLAAVGASIGLGGALAVTSDEGAELRLRTLT
jgi:hypothetical protein